MLSHRSQHNGNARSNKNLHTPSQRAVVENLEARQLLSASVNETVANLTHVMGASHIEASAKLTLAQKQAAAAAKKAALVAREIAAFQKHLSIEIRTHSKKLTSPVFQQHIMTEQAKFAAKVAKQGGTYTVVPFSQLLVGTAAPLVAPTVTATANSPTAIGLSWTASTGAVSYKLETSADGGTTWTVLASVPGTTYSNVGLTAGTVYKYRVTAIGPASVSPASAVASATTFLNAPTNFTAAATSATSVSLAWTVVASATSYKLERSTDGSTWTALAPSPALTGSSTSYADTVSPGSTYYYRISTISASGTSSPALPVTASTYPAQPVLTPNVISTTEIDLAWAAVASAFSYKLERSTDGGTTWSTLATQSATSYADTGLTADTTYKYRLTAINATGNSAVSAVVSGTTILLAPTGLTATDLSTTTIALAWIPVTDATSYKLERSIDGVTFTTVAASPALTATSTSYTDTGLNSGATYTYRLSAIDASGTSAASSTASALTLSVAPAITATVISASEIDLSWTPSTGATSYKLERSIDGGVTWSALATQSTTTYNNTGLTASTAYQYRVSASSAAGTSALSTVASGTTLPPTPTSFAQAVASATEIDLSWTPVISATSYKIERSLNGTTWTALSPSPALTGASNNYNDIGLSAGTSYTYRISTVNAVGTSTAVVGSPLLTLPAVPTLTAVVNSATQVGLSWTSVTSANSYKLEVSTDSGNTWSTLATQSGLTYTNSGLNADTNYKYRVSASNSTGYGALSNIPSVTTYLTAPAGLSLTSASATEIDLSWPMLVDATTYKIEQSNNGTTWTTLTPSPALTGTSTTYAATGLTAGTQYYFRVSGVDAAGTSAPTTAVSAFTLPGVSTITPTVISANEIDLSWTAVTGATNYKLELSADGGNTWSTLVTQATTTYKHLSLTADTTYKYRVSATNTAGYGATSAVVSGTTTLGAPTGLTVTVVSPSEIDLAWTAQSDATTYKLERSTNGTTWTTLVPSPALTGASNSYADTTVLAGTSYYYRISGTNGSGTSVTTTSTAYLTLPAASVITAAAASATTVSLSWTASTSATSYKVEVSSDGGNTWSTLVTQSTLTYSQTGVTPNITYKYRVTAINGSGNSAVSAVASVNTTLPAPTGLATTPISATEIDLAWTAVTAATSYRIDRSTDGVVWTILTPSPALTGTSISYHDATVLPGTTYSYRITTIDGANVSAVSTSVNGLTFPVTPVISATAVSTTQINVSWTPSASATSYKLETSINAGTTWTTLATQAGTTYNNTGLAAGASYLYRVSAINASGTSVVSPVYTISTIVTNPAAFTLSSAAATSMTLTWSPIANANTYKIERSIDEATWTVLAPSPALTSASVTYTDTGLNAGVVYYYRLTPIDTTGTFGPAIYAQGLTLAAAPTLTATAVSASQVNLTWTAAASASSYIVQISADGGTTWTNLATPSVTAYSSTTLAPDTQYKFRVAAVNAAGTGANSANATATTLLAAPTGFSASVPSASEIDVTWTTVNDATTYKLERSLNGITWITLAPSPALTGSSIGYADTGLAAGTTYYYRISAINTNGTSAPATAITATTLAAAPALTATVTSATAVALSWTPVVSATNYLLERSIDGGVTWTSVATQSTTTYSDSGRTSDTAYKYRVSATNGTVYGATSAVASVTTLLSTPTGFTVTVALATEIDLTWNSTADATSYKIERSLNGTTWTTLVPSPALTGGSNAYADTTVAAGTSYTYRISTVNGSGQTVPAVATAVTTLPAAPALTASATSPTIVSLSWTAVASATNYKLQSSIDGVNWTTLATQTATTYLSTGLTSNGTYLYRVSATNATGYGANSATATVTTLLLPPTFSTPAVVSSTEIDLAWTAVSGATTYKVERSLNNLTWTTLAPSPALTGTTTTYADTGLVAGTTYYYRISSIDAVGTSVASSVVSTITLPAAPVLSAAVTSATTINLTWTAVASATNYLLERSADGGNTWSTVATQSTVSYTNTALTADTVYKYRVSATNATGYGATSTVVTSTTILPAVTGFTATVASATQISLSWIAVSDATSYKIERSLNNSAWTTLVPSPALTGTSASYIDTSVAGGTTYYYRISAIDAAGTSASAPSGALLTFPAAPTLAGSVVSPTAINFSWTPILSATNYKLEKSTDGGTTWSTVITQSTATYSATGLTADTAYQFRLSATNATGYGATSTVVSITTLLNAPGGVTATVASGTEVDLAWTASVDATSYKIERSLNNLTWTTLAPSPALTGSSTSYADTGLTAGTTYYYRLSAISAAGTSAPAATGATLTLPAVPTLTATVVSSTQVNLSWTPSLSATGYRLQQSIDGGFTWTTLASPTVTTYINTGLTANTSYQYRVAALNATGTSANSSASVVTTFQTAANNFTATAVSTTEIDLSWTTATSATGYKLEQSINNTIWTTLAPSPALTGSSTGYAVTGLTAGTTYYFRISTITVSGTSAPGAAITQSTLSVAPTVTATPTSSSQVNLTWNAVTGATSYLVQISANAGSTWTVLATPATTMYTASGLTPDTAYQFKVSAVNAGGTSASSAAASASTLLTSPTGFGATVISGSEIDLAWTAVTDATTYKIERSTDNITWTTLSPSPALTGTSSAYNDTSVSAGTNYYYRISATSAGGNSAPSVIVQGLTYPAVPTLSATAISTTAISLSWPAVAGATSYKIEASANAGTTWSTLATQAANTYSHTALTVDTSYQYRVSAINGSGTSAASPVVTISTLLAAPTTLALTAASANEIDLAWTASTDATGYKIERSLNNAIWTTLTPSPALTGSSSSYNDTGLTAGTTYYYRLSAISASGTSAPETPVNAMTLPIAPTLTATPASATAVNLSWNAVPSATNYKLESSPDGSTWTTLTTQATTTYVNNSLTTNTAYEYRVSASNGGSFGATSAVQTVTTLLVSPTLTPSVVSTSEIDLAWTAPTGATNFKLERSLNNTTWTTIVPSPAFTGSSASYNDTGLAAGTTYYYRISAISAAGTAAPATVASAITLPVAPTLTATATTTTSNTLTWTAVTGATSYKIESSVNGGTSWTTLATQSTLSYVDTGLSSDNLIEYRVSATNGVAYGATSAVQSVTVLLASPTLSLTVAAANEIDLSWSAVTDATGYKIERSLNNTTWTTLVPSPALTGSSASYNDTTLAGGTTYYYRISVINASGTSAPSATVNAQTVPAAPTLTATVVSATAVNLSWTTVTGATNYKLETSADGGSTWTTLATQTTTAFSNTGLTTDSPYKYRVSATNGTTYGATSSVSSVTTLLLAPGTLTASSPSTTEIDLTWAAVTDATNYKIERSLNGTTWTTIVPSPALTGSSTAYNNTGLVAGTTYHYRISAIDASGTSAPITPITAATLCATPTLAATVASATSVNLAWTAVAGATNYKLETSADSGSTWTTLATQTTTTYTNSGLTTDTPYQYRVSATNGAAYGATSTVQTVTTFLVSPTLTTTVVSTTEIDLAWTAPADATTFKIERSLNGTIWTTLVPSPALTGSSAAYNDTTLTAGTKYYYRISAVSASGTAAPSAVVNAITLPTAPTLTATPISSTQINLTWTSVIGATNYKLETSVDAGNTWTTLATQATTSYSDTLLTTDTAHEYRVSATNGTTYGATSSVITTGTLLVSPTLTLTAASGTEIDLTWSAVTDATSYKIERSTTGTIWTTLAPSPALTGSSASYNDTTLTAGTKYYYRISAISAIGASAPAAVVNATTLPAAPTLIATVATATAVNLSWTTVATATSYKLETSTDGGSTWTTLVTQSNTTFANTGLTTDTSYKYRVSASNGGAFGATSAVQTVTTLLLAPGTPTATTASSTEIDLAWATVTDATGFKIERSLNQTTWTTLTPSPALTGSSTSYNDTGLTVGTTYYYRISSIGVSGTSTPTAVLTQTTALAAPTGLVATAASSSQINLTWTTDTAAGLTGFVLQGSADGSTGWTTLLTLGPTANSTADIRLTTATTYYYRLMAVNAGGNSAASAVVHATTL